MVKESAHIKEQTMVVSFTDNLWFTRERGGKRWKIKGIRASEKDLKECCEVEWVSED